MFLPLETINKKNKTKQKELFEFNNKIIVQVEYLPIKQMLRLNKVTTISQNKKTINYYHKPIFPSCNMKRKK